MAGCVGLVAPVFIWMILEPSGRAGPLPTTRATGKTLRHHLAGRRACSDQRCTACSRPLCWPTSGGLETGPAGVHRTPFC